MTALRRPILAAGLLLLGAVAATRLVVGPQPAASEPAVLLELDLPQAGDPADVARRWAVPLESVARSLPGVTTVDAEVSASGVRVVAGLRRGARADLAAARASAGLSSLRRALPEEGHASAAPLASREEPGVLAALSGPDAVAGALACADALRAIDGVRDVRVDGVPDRELRIALRTGGAALAARVLGEAAATRSAPRLGVVRWGLDHVTSVVGAREGAVAGMGRVPVAIDAIAIPFEGRRPVERVAHLDGRRVVLVEAIVADGASIFRVDRDVRRALDVAMRARPGLAATIVASDADALRRALLRLGLGLAIASGAGLVVGFARFGARGAWRLALGVPLGLAAALNVLVITRHALDVASAPLVGIAVASALPLSLARLAGHRHAGALVAWLSASAALVPIGIHLASGALAPEWARPAEAFALAALASALASLVWAPLPHARPRSRRVGRALRAPLRDPGTALLFTGTALYVAFTLFGRALDPTGESVRTSGAALDTRFSMPEGTSLARMETALADVEAWLRDQPGVERTWSRAGDASAWLLVTLDAGHRKPAEIERLRWRLAETARVADVAARVNVRGAAASSALLASSGRDAASTDAHAFAYRVLLRASSAEALATSVDRAQAVASQAGIPSQLQDVESPSPSQRVELIPRADAEPADVGALAAALRAESSSPPRRAWPAREETALVVTWPGAREPTDAAPQRADVIDGPLRAGGVPRVARSLVSVRDRVVPPSLVREAGRFVVPVTFHMADFSEDLRKQKRARLDTGLSQLRLPDGCEIERPSLARAWAPERVRLLALAVAAPAALVLLAGVALDSLVAALVALVPLACGVAFGAAALVARGAPFDGLAFTLLAAATCAALPWPLALLAPSRGATHAGARWSALRAARRTLPMVTLAAMSALALALACRGLDGVEDAWKPPLVAAACAAAAAALSGVVVAPAATIAIAEARRRMGRDGALLRRPPAWRAPGEPDAVEAEPVLAVRHVTKDYASGFRALHDVSFELHAGIVGLLGPNGAGKTTLLRTLTGLLQPTRGEVSWRGVVVRPENLDAFRRQIGFLPQEFNAYPGLTAREFLEYWAIERGLRDGRARDAEIAERLAEVGLTSDADRVVRDFSGGMRQRLGIARALLGSPPLLLVDEPTTGLDVESRTRFRETLVSVAARRLVVLSTHVASDVEATASRLMLIHAGRVHFDGSPAALVARAQGRVVETILDDAELAAFSRRHRVTARVRVLAGIRVRAVIAPGVPLPGPPAPPTLEEAYLAEMDGARGP